jgi:hypothetical protein
MQGQMTHEKWETITEVLDLLDLHRDSAADLLEQLLEEGRVGNEAKRLEGKIHGLDNLRTSLVNRYRR